MKRRSFSQTIFGAFGASLIRTVAVAQATDQVARIGKELGVSTEGWITDVEGIRVGHFTDARRPTRAR